MVLPGVAPVSVPSVDDCSWSASPPLRGGRLHRNRWPACVGISGRNGSESLAALPRNTHPKALKEIRRAVRGWSLQTRSDKELDDLARMFNPYIRGWINYYGHFYKSALYPTLMRIDAFSLGGRGASSDACGVSREARGTGCYG